MFNGHGFGFGFGGGFMWLFWILIVLAIVWAVRATTAGGGTSHGEERTPIQILEERLARGEIDEVEFDRKRKALKG